MFELIANRLTLLMGVDHDKARRICSGPFQIHRTYCTEERNRLGFESVVRRDYPVVFATLYIFSLMGLLVGLISDIVYTMVDPRIDFERRDV